jgi:pilus assembly protein CpaF
MCGYEEKKKRLRQAVLDEIDLTRTTEEKELLEVIDKAIVKESKKGYISLDEKRRLRQDIYNSIKKLDVLQEFVDNPDITEIMVNGKEKIFVEQEGKINKTEKNFESKEKYDNVIQQIVAGANRLVNEASPIVDARLKDGSRVNVVLEPVAIDGSAVTIRKFPKNPLTMENLIQQESITKEAAEFLKNLVEAGYNIFISGGTGSGKTTFLNILSNYIPREERIITIEDSAELQLQNIENLVRLEVRNANTEGKNGISIRELIRCALRMRPQRIIVGEVRGEECLDMLQAMNTGHDGSISTGHGNSTVDMISRLETMVLMGTNMPVSAIRRQIASAIDIFVHLGRMRDHTRRVLEISEMIGYREGELITKAVYEFHEFGVREDGKIDGRLVKVTEDLVHKQKLYTAGIIRKK